MGLASVEKREKKGDLDLTWDLFHWLVATYTFRILRLLARQHVEDMTWGVVIVTPLFAMQPVSSHRERTRERRVYPLA